MVFMMGSVLDRLPQWMPFGSAKQMARRRFRSVSLGPQDVCIDCGANVGEFTRFMARRGSTVYAFEPNPHAFAVLEEAFRENERVHCLQQGVFDRAGTSKLFLHELAEEDELRFSESSSLLGFKGNVNRDRYVEVEVIDLCAFIRDLGRPVRLLKMDVEGVETRILKKLIESGLAERIDHAFVETHDHKIPEIREDTDALRRTIADRKLTQINLDWR